MDLSLFDFDLPVEQIAQYPAQVRDTSKLLHYHANSNTNFSNTADNTAGNATANLTDYNFYDLPKLLKPKDLLVLNNSFVIAARIFGHKATGSKVEIMLERAITDNTALALVKSNRVVKTGTVVHLQDKNQTENTTPAKNEATATINSKNGALYEIEFSHSVDDIIAKFGHVPLPPYIKREANTTDADRYQTVYADDHEKGSVATPTAGLHFTSDLLAKLEQQGINHAFVTLHVGAGTFKPVRSDDISQHKMHKEYFHIDQQTVDAINHTKSQGGRIIAVGTTSLRCLESIAKNTKNNTLTAQSGHTELFIYPPYKFQIVDGLLTNFHTPRSSLLMLICAFLQHISHQDGIEIMQQTYAYAVANKYRFFSYGDSMLIL